MTEMSASPLQSFGAYVLLEQIGKGAMSEVFKARDPKRNDSIVAIKRIREEFLEKKHVLDLFESEAATLSQLEHPNLVSIYSSGKVGEYPYIVMEYVDGFNLGSLYDTLLIRGTPLPTPHACYIVKEAAKALFYLHTAKDAEGNPLKILHTDLAARNILISRDGKIKLIDFSIGQAVFNLARTGSNESWCALADVSPEMARGQLLDERSDVYQLGLVLYKTLIGKTPFGDKKNQELHKAILKFDVRTRPFPESIDKDLKEIICKSLAPDPAQRFATAELFERAVSSHLQKIHPGYNASVLANYVSIMDAPQPTWYGALGRVLETIDLPKKPKNLRK
jgi:Serine/threonine protein kinase